jgi:hypothetical protein
MSLTTPSNTLNTFPQNHVSGRLAPVSHDLFDVEETSGEKNIPTLFTTLTGTEKRELPEVLS